MHEICKDGWKRSVLEGKDISENKKSSFGTSKGVLLTKDNLLKRGWKGASCSMCGFKETIQHLFFDCHVARFLWNTLFITFNI